MIDFQSSYREIALMNCDGSDTRAEAKLREAGLSAWQSTYWRLLWKRASVFLLMDGKVFAVVFLDPLLIPKVSCTVEICRERDCRRAGRGRPE
jgi:hypothetical protein